MFFKDDFYLFNQAISTSALDWFNPFLAKAYRPLGAEVFYAVVHYIGRDSYLFSLIIILVTFFVGLYFLYRVANIFSKSKRFSRILVFVYFMSSSHLFQLLWLATYQEVLMFAAFMASSYYWILKKYKLSIGLFLIALLSKETVIVYPFFFLFYEIWKKKDTKEIEWGNAKKYLFLVFSVVIVFVLSRITPMRGIESSPEYMIHLSPKLIFTNFYWYTAWGFGAPSFFPDYFSSIFARPIPSFWEVTKPLGIQIYIYLWLIQMVSLIVIVFFLKTKNNVLKIAKVFVYCLFGVFLSLLPVLPIIHRWPVRLTVPVVFTSIIISYIVYKLNNKLITILFLILYMITQLFGWNMHFETSTFSLESKISKKAYNYVKNNEINLKLARGICIYDKVKTPQSEWKGAKKLKITLHDQEFWKLTLKKQIKIYYLEFHEVSSCPLEYEKIDASKFF